MIHALQDKHVDLKRVTEAIAATGRKIADAMDPYLLEGLFHGRAAERTEAFIARELKPLMNRMRLSGTKMADFEEYLWMRHAPERNAQIARIDKDRPDGGAGVSTKKARDYLAALDPKKKAVFESLAADVDAITGGTLDLLVAEGLETAEAAAAMREAYEFYVPLHRAETEDSGAGTGAGNGTGQGMSIRGPETRRAVGSDKAAVDILGNLVMARERAITRAEKNRVSNALLGLALTNPNPDFWRVDAAPKERVVERGADGKDHVVERVRPGFGNAPNVVFTKVKGQAHYIVFNENDARAMRLAESMKNLDAEEIGAALAGVGKATRYFSAMATQYNPIFGVVNLFRDTQEAMLNLQSTPIAGRQGEVLRNIGAAAQGIWAALRGKEGAKPGEWGRLWAEFQREGGKTGYRDSFANAAGRAEKLREELGDFGEGWTAKAREAIFRGKNSAFMQWLSDYNEMMENAVRLSAYKSAVDSGMSRPRAAMLAKELTVNFNRKGAKTRQIGALYAFFNASAQGTARIAQTLFDRKGGRAALSRTGKQIVSGGLLLGAMQAALLAAAGFDDDEPPEFVRESNFVKREQKKQAPRYLPPMTGAVARAGAVIPSVSRHARSPFERKALFQRVRRKPTPFVSARLPAFRAGIRS
ncbi:MAG: hypothetical protein LBI87_12480 [Candidatus Accumulibacter sp.]|nr:hypothetical protein [Accumulibacter sp.]